MRRQGFSSRWVETSVGPVHVYEGRGLADEGTVVFLHGFSASGGQFGPVLRRVRPGFRRLLALDLPAHGGSPVPSTGPRYEGLRDGMFEALDQLLPFGGRAMVVGNSMGGFGAIRYAVARPERVDALGLISPGGAAMGPKDLDDLRGLFDLGNGRDAVVFLDRLLSQPHPLRWAMAPFVRGHLSRPEYRALMESLSSEVLLDPSELHQLRMPVLFLWGGRDKILPASSREFFLTHLPPHTEVRTPLHLGHSPQLEAPGEVARILLGFRESLVRPAWAR